MIKNTVLLITAYMASQLVVTGQNLTMNQVMDSCENRMVGDTIRLDHFLLQLKTLVSAETKLLNKADGFRMIGNSYYRKFEYDSAVYYFNQAFSLFKKLMTANINNCLLRF